ncbi:MAG: TonB-dependent receptor [Bacteroidota bacterium]
MKPTPYLIFVFLFSLSLLMAQQTTQDSITSLDEIVLLEDEIAKKAVGITPTSQVGIVELERFGPSDFASGINQISGVYVLSGALNTNRITIRGVGARTPFGTDKLRLYFNGIPVTNGTGASTIEAYDFENLGTIEVVKGPKGTTLGANLGGAIVLHTKPPKVGRTFASNSFTIGSYDMVKNNFAFRHSDQKFHLNFSYNHLQTDGYRQNNSFERDGFLFSSGIKLYSKGKLDLLINHIDYTAEIPSSINRTDFQENPRRAAANWLAARGFEDNRYTLVGISHSHNFNADLKMTHGVFYTYLDHYEPRPFNILDEFTNGFGLRSMVTGRVFEGDFSIGAELYKDEYDWSTFQNEFRDNNGNGSLQGAQLSDNKEFRTQLNLFGTFSKELAPRLSAQLGLNLNQTDYDFRDLFNTVNANTSAERDFDPILLPSFGLQYILNNGQLYANVSRGFSNPSLEETLTPDGVINPAIEQEKGTSYEVGGRFSLFKHTLNLGTVLYRMDINDLLVADRVGEDQFIGRNAGKTRHQGIELDANYRIRIWKHWMVLPYLSYTLNDHSFVDFVDGDDDFSGNPLTGVPKNRIQSGIALRHAEGVTVTLNHQYVDDIPLTDANTIQSESFHVFRLNARYRTTLFHSLRLAINGGINNLFDETYAQSVLINATGFGGAEPRYFYPGNDRNWYGGVQLSYDF